jgi:hypothetical protein
LALVFDALKHDIQTPGQSQPHSEHAERAVEVGFLELGIGHVKQCNPTTAIALGSALAAG